MIAAMPFIVLFFWSVHRHYGTWLRRCRLAGSPAETPHRARCSYCSPTNPRDARRDRLPARGAADGLTGALRGSRGGIRGDGVAVAARGTADGTLERLEGADRHLVRAVRYVRALPRHERDRFLTVVIPEPSAPEHGLAVHPSPRGVPAEDGAVVRASGGCHDVPLVPSERPTWSGDRPVEPERSVVSVPVSRGARPHGPGGDIRKSLNPTAIEAIYLVTEPDEVPGVIDAWHDRQLDVLLVLVEALFRDLGPPLLDESAIRRLAATPS